MLGQDLLAGLLQEVTSQGRAALFDARQLLAFLVLLGIFVDPRRNDGAQRMLCRVVMKAAGAKLVVRRSPGFDPARTCFLLINHVNLFDPFVLYATVPQFVGAWNSNLTFGFPCMAG